MLRFCLTKQEFLERLRVIATSLSKSYIKTQIARTKPSWHSFWCRAMAKWSWPEPRQKNMIGSWLVCAWNHAFKKSSNPQMTSNFITKSSTLWRKSKMSRSTKIQGNRSCLNWLSTVIGRIAKSVRDKETIRVSNFDHGYFQMVYLCAIPVK